MPFGQIGLEMETHAQPHVPGVVGPSKGDLGDVGRSNKDNPRSLALAHIPGVKNRAHPYPKPLEPRAGGEGGAVGNRRSPGLWKSNTQRAG